MVDLQEQTHAQQAGTRRRQQPEIKKAYLRPRTLTRIGQLPRHQ